MKVDVLKRVSKEQFAKACDKNKLIIGVCRALDITQTEANRLECVYKVDLPRNKHGFRKFDHDKIYDTYLKNERSSRKTAKIIGCHPATVVKIVQKREEDDNYSGR